MALKRVWIPSPNFSSRGGAIVRMLVLHTTEGARTIESLGNWFGQTSTQASSHVGADDKPNTVGEYVRQVDKAWTCAEFNPVSLNIELCAWASWSTAEWNSHPKILDNCAQWIAEECKRYDLPITRLTPAQAQGSGRGVCQHSDLGSRGGGHHDCGPGFPMDKVLEMARSYAGGSTPPTPTPPKEEDIVAIATGVNNAGAFHVFVEAKDGSVWYTWQRKNESNWEGGAPGKSVAGLQPFAPAPK